MDGGNPMLTERSESSDILCVICVADELSDGYVEFFATINLELSILGVTTEILVILSDSRAGERISLDLLASLDYLHICVVTGVVDLARAFAASLELTRATWIAVVDPEADLTSTVLQMFCSVAHAMTRVSSGVLDSTDADCAAIEPRAFLLSRSDAAHLGQQSAGSVRCGASTDGDRHRDRVLRRVHRRVPARAMDDRPRSRVRSSGGVGLLRLVHLLCGASACCAAAYSIVVLAVYSIRHEVVPGWTSISLALSGMFVTLALVLWLLSEYMLTSIAPSIRRPRYEIADTFGTRIRSADRALNVEMEL